jgi:hypothetical protein
MRLLALGALGYVAYRYLKQQDEGQRRERPELALAGGPLSGSATLQHPGDDPLRDWPTLDREEA